MSARTTSDQVLRVFLGVFAALVIVGAAAGVWRFVQYARHPPGGFGCMSMQSEARVNLRDLRTAEKAFYGEYNTYTTDLVELNWFPDGAPRYLYGFARPGGRAKIDGIDELDPTRDNTADPRVIAAGKFETRKMLDLADQPLTASELPAIAVATSNGFVAAAIADMVDDDKKLLDVWTIDQDEHETVVVNDCLN